MDTAGSHDDFIDKKFLSEPKRDVDFYKECLRGDNASRIANFVDFYAFPKKIEMTDMPMLMDIVATYSKCEELLNSVDLESLDGKEYKMLNNKEKGVMWIYGVLQHTVSLDMIELCDKLERCGGAKGCNNEEKLTDLISFISRQVSEKNKLYKEIVNRLLNIMRKVKSSFEIILYMFVDSEGICRVNETPKVSGILKKRIEATKRYVKASNDESNKYLGCDLNEEVKNYMMNMNMNM
jgi:hypothetical protein